MNQNDVFLRLMGFAILLALLGIAFNVGMLFYFFTSGALLCQ